MNIHFAHFKWISQNAFPNPACFKTALAVLRDLMVLSTTNGMPLIGLNHIEWSNFPTQMKWQPDLLKIALSSCVKLFTSDWPRYNNAIGMQVKAYL